MMAIIAKGDAMKPEDLQKVMNGELPDLTHRELSCRQNETIWRISSGFMTCPLVSKEPNISFCIQDNACPVN